MFTKYLKKHLYTNTFLATILIALVFACNVQATPLSASQENLAINDVVGAFNALAHHGEWLGFHMIDAYSGQSAPDTYPPPYEEHIQGIARSPQTGTPIFYVTRSGNVHDPDYYGSLIVVEMGTRDTDGERLRSNRLLRGEETRTTPPHTLDRVIKNIPYNDWEHAGGIQMVGDILAVPLEGTLDGSEKGKVIFYDCSTPRNPQKLSYELDFPDHKVGVVGITKLSDGHFFMIVTWGYNETVEFYRSNKESFFEEDFAFGGFENGVFVSGEPHTIINRTELENLGGYWPIDDGDWQTVGDYPFQTLNFVNQADGELFLIASRNSDSMAPHMFSEGDDLMYLLRVTGFGENQTANFHAGLRSHKYLSSEGCWNTWAAGGLVVSQNIQANFNAGAGAYISPTGELLYYATSHYNKGPYGTVKMAELRHNWVSSSRTCGPQFDDNHLGGPYRITEGDNITVNGEVYLDGHCLMPWVQMFADSNFQGPMVMMDFPDQFSDDYNDFSKLDGCLTPAPDGFNDQLSSFRFNGPPGSILLLFDDDNYRIGNTSYPAVPGTGKVTEVPFVGSYFNDEATSALLLWNGYSSQPYSWDLDNDGEFDDAFGPMATFHAGPWNSTNIVRMKYVYSDAWTFNGLGFPISFPETYAILDTIINVGSVILTVDAGPDITIDEGSIFESIGNFTDFGPGPWEATIDYGDGFAVQNLTINQDDKTFDLSHIYDDNGVYTVTVTVRAFDGDEGSDAVIVTVENRDVVVNAGPDITASSGESINIHAGFDDPGVNDNPWDYIIDWGDKTSETTGSINIQGVDTITGVHQYIEPGIYAVIITAIDKDGGMGTDTIQVAVESISVEIDIKPGSNSSSINPDSHGVTPVAVLTDGNLDATTVQGDTCRFGPDEAAPKQYTFEDVDNDGDLDMILHFPTQDTGLTLSDAEASLTGRTTDGWYISGTDVVRMVPPKGKKEKIGKN